ncbi:hypothetical protein [Paenibacillus sp. FSL R5-0701]|uniref:hypothetical protein n=1 Tax=Paenibacillus sp. FSL R5-0701 TaxID=2921654 RepID=UPI0030CE7CF0
MIPELKVYLSKPDGSITWNTDWISEFESPWSIFQKIQFTNLLNKRDYFHLFGTSETIKKKTIVGARNHNLYSMPSFDDNRFIIILGFSLKKYNSDVIKNISGFLNDGGMREMREISSGNWFWRKSLTFCCECLIDGYHSILHQFGLFQQCPFHQKPLYDQCPNCSAKYPYELFKDQTYFESTLTCMCSHQYKKFNRGVPLNTHWKAYRSNDLSDKLAIQWLNLNQLQKSNLSSVYLYPHTSINETPQLLKFYLNYIERDTTPDQYNVETSDHLKRINNIPYLKGKYIRKKNREFENINTAKNHITFFSNHQNIVMSEFQIIRNSMFSSVAKHLRRTILKKHKSCIKRYTSVIKTNEGMDIPICPYASAYVKWKQKIMKIVHFYDVDAIPYSRTSFCSENVSFLGYLDEDPIFDIMNSYLAKFPTKKSNYSYISWLISHTYSYLFLHLFKLYLTDSVDKIIENKDLTLKETILAFSFPGKLSDKVQKFWDQNNLNHFFSENELICPYPTIRSKRRTSNEESFHPMQLALNRDRSHI